MDNISWLLIIIIISLRQRHSLLDYFDSRTNFFVFNIEYQNYLRGTCGTHVRLNKSLAKDSDFLVIASNQIEIVRLSESLRTKKRCNVACLCANNINAITTKVVTWCFYITTKAYRKSMQRKRHIPKMAQKHQKMPTWRLVIICKPGLWHGYPKISWW